MAADTVEITVGYQRPSLDDELAAAGVTFEPKAKAVMEAMQAAIGTLDAGLRPDVRAQRTDELRDVALEQAVTEYERAGREELKPFDQAIGTLRNELKGTVIPARAYELPEAAAKREELERRRDAFRREAQTEITFLSASQDTAAIADAALDALASELTPTASRRVAQLAIERLRALRPSQAGTREADEHAAQLRAVEAAYRAYAETHPTGRERLAALEAKRAATIRARRSSFELLKQRYGYRSRRGLVIDGE